ncbi:hypothetical protein TPHA_0B04900 [Tetrapisispora phaffii CBS 4417]|uniref:Cytochrome b-c1 complex subunit 7 n=1 Tax=Tetrapisispora phaffii (strain ATCC 24235 / CBS 4417 / NBRC 1672 / NRRL Y-8282 / UCD 70-5) TaxID=1071381 RepID=G8BQ79_TETPH|nr:hypothetical protein TPHA_0B04900 [Tetrapisispora phaffii CBS 4417]CCE62160.1 hypothetical protein TPHA_0B04900 [Tetrapisispora phaffii CBS 4417]
MTQSLTSIVRIGDRILKSPTLSKLCVPVARKFVDLSGYRKLGLKFDDLIAEESPLMQKVLRRLPEEESYTRNYRIIRAHQTELTHHLLPKTQWIQAKEDVPYLLPYILEAEAAAKEKDELDNLIIEKK